jgi:hypothetical protein
MLPVVIGSEPRVHNWIEDPNRHGAIAGLHAK